MVLRLRPFVGIISFGLVGLALLAFFYKKTTVPEIDRDIQHKFDLGFVPLGHVFTKTVSVTNKSTETWKLKEIRQSCSCTQAEVERHLLKPGESTDVTVQFTSPDQEADSRHSVQLLFQADCQPSVTISVQSKTRKPLSVDRKHLEITTTNLKPIAMVELMVRNHSGIPWSTVCCDELPTHIHVQSCKKLPSVDQVETWKLEIAIDGSQLKSVVESGSLTVRTENQTESISYLLNHDEGIRYSPVKFDVVSLQSERILLRTTVQIDGSPANLTKDDFSFSIHETQARIELEQLTIQRPGRAVLQLAVTPTARSPGRQTMMFDIVYGGPQGVKQTMTLNYRID